MRLPKRPTETQGASDSDQPDSITVLLVTAKTSHQAEFRTIFERANWRLDCVQTLAETDAYVREHGPAVVICEKDLPDGDWKMVLNRFETLPSKPNLIVTSRLADEALWAEVLNLGGYDVLVQPFDADEVSRVVFLAWHEHHRRSSKPEASRSAPAQMKASQASL